MAETETQTKSDKPKKIMPRHRRQALRHAQKMGLDPKDGDAAIEMLRARGIDIFTLNDSILDIAKAEPMDAVTLPTNATPTLPSGKPEGAMTVAQREIEIDRIRLELVRRRRKRLMLLWVKMFFFVFVPTALVAYYYYYKATPMYRTQSAFVIQTNTSGGGGSGGIGGILSGTGFATSQDSIVVQDYLLSKEAFLRIDEDLAYSAHFQDPGIDDIQRLAADASLDQSYDVYRRNVTIGYDPTEGVIRMEVTARTPEQSQTFAEALVTYAEERVDGLSQEARGDRVKDAEARYLEAEADMLTAQQRVLDLQQQRGVLSADAEITSQLAIINSLEVELESRRLSLAEQLDNTRPSAARVSALEREIDRLETRIAQLRAGMVTTDDNSVPIARISAELQVAETELVTRQALLQQALQAVEAAQTEADKQVRYLSMGVAPIAPQDPSSPAKFSNTALAFLLFAGVYVVMSLTVSILREQVSV
ncbi:MAG: capsule biosynthesis protein [Pseudomonadota bacterium]